MLIEFTGLISLLSFVWNVFVRLFAMHSRTNTARIVYSIRHCANRVLWDLASVWPIQGQRLLLKSSLLITFFQHLIKYEFSFVYDDDDETLIQQNMHEFMFFACR